jgi:hypothetical protein
MRGVVKANERRAHDTGQDRTQETGQVRGSTGTGTVGTVGLAARSPEARVDDAFGRRASMAAGMCAAKVSTRAENPSRDAKSKCGRSSMLLMVLMPRMVLVLVLVLVLLIPTLRLAAAEAIQAVRLCTCIST